AKENRIVSKEPVAASTPTGRITGAAMTMRTDTHEATFVGHVTAHLAAAAQAAVGETASPAQAGAASQGREQPVDVTSDNLDVKDAPRTGVSRGGVVPPGGDTRLKTPEMHVAYESKGDAATAVGQPDSAHLTRVLAVNGSVLTLGIDRRVS